MLPWDTLMVRSEEVELRCHAPLGTLQDELAIRYRPFRPCHLCVLSEGSRIWPLLERILL